MDLESLRFKKDDTIARTNSTVSISRELAERLNEFCKPRGIIKTSLVEVAITQALDELESQ